eukprot:scaffold72783_cov69-Phaeocystis_antarctica.AAC.4
MKPPMAAGVNSAPSSEHVGVRARVGRRKAKDVGSHDERSCAGADHVGVERGVVVAPRAALDAAGRWRVICVHERAGSATGV